MIEEKHKSRFWDKVVKGPNCWEWIGAYRAKDNYGVFTIGYKSYSAPRLSYEISVGKIPDGLNILHSCDNRRCVNPSHLRPGTQRENLRDCISRGRHIPPKGERNGMSILSALQVKNIRNKFTNKRGQMTSLAKEYGVSIPAIHSIVRGNRWKQEDNNERR